MGIREPKKDLVLVEKILQLSVVTSAALTAPARGMVIFDSSNKIYIYNGTAWELITSVAQA